MNHHQTMEAVFDSYDLDPCLWTKVRNVLAVLALAGWVATAVAFAFTPARAAQSWLVAVLFCTTILIGALFFVMLQHLTGAAWSVTARRTAENLAASIPAAAALFIPVALTLPHLYEWVHHPAEGKESWLNPQAFLIRAGICFSLWSFWALKLHRLSVAQDTAPRPNPAAARWSAPGMIVLTLTTCLAGFDWLMSLTPHWYSTMFGIYVYAGAGLAGFSALTLVLLALRRADVLRYSVNHEHYHDLGKWIFGLTVFWAYIAFCQYLLIWYANLPEETVWYRDRLAGNWRYLAATLVIGHFFVPFFTLLNRAGKRRLWLLSAAAAWVLLMHYIDLYWIAMPVFSKDGPSPAWTDLSALLATAATIGLAFWARLRRHALAPVGDVRFEKSLEFENV